MKFRSTGVSRTSGQVIALVVILLAIFGLGAWWLNSSRHHAEESAQAFARELTNRVTISYDEKFLRNRLSPEAKMTLGPAYTGALIGHLREWGVPLQPIDVKGKLDFNNYFFEPRGQFKAQLNYYNVAAHLDLEISHPKALWQIDTINLTWDPPHN